MSGIDASRPGGGVTASPDVQPDASPPAASSAAATPEIEPLSSERRPSMAAMIAGSNHEPAIASSGRSRARLRANAWGIGRGDGTPAAPPRRGRNQTARPRLRRGVVETRRHARGSAAAWSNQMPRPLASLGRPLVALMLATDIGFVRYALVTASPP